MPEKEFDKAAYETAQIQRLADSLEIPSDISEGETWGSHLKKKLKIAWWRLENDGHDNYSLLEAMKAILSEHTFAVRRGEQNPDDPQYKKYRKYLPMTKKTHQVKEVSFVSTYNCGTPRDVAVPLEKTADGQVRPKAPGFFHCSSWSCCPVDAALIFMRRNEELHKIIDKANAEKKGVIMITLTAPHYKYMSLLDCSTAMQGAFEHMVNSRGWKNRVLAKRDLQNISFSNGVSVMNVGGWGLLYYSKTMETKVGGENGWHNHFHVLGILSSWISDEDLFLLTATIRELWEKSCEKFGLIGKTEKARREFRAHSVQVTKDFDPDYLAKQSEEWKKARHVSENWGAAEELTLSHCKKKSVPQNPSEKGSVTVFEHVVHMCEKAFTGKYEGAEGLLAMRKDVDIVIEYGCAMKGRAAIVFSKGLKDWAGLEDKTDKQLAEEVREVGETICMIDRRQVHVINEAMAYKPIKKALSINHTIAIPKISEWLVSRGCAPLWSAADADLFMRSRAGLVADDEFYRLTVLLDTLHRQKATSSSTISAPVPIIDNASPPKEDPLFEQLTLF